MKTAQRMQRIGQWLFLFMWIPFLCIFLGNIGEIFGSAGVRIAQDVNRYIPGLLGTSGEELSILSQVSLVLTLVMAVLAMLLTFGSLGFSSAANSRVRAQGKEASATITHLASTGTRVNNNPMVHFTLEVKPADGSPAFFAETEQLVDIVNLPRLQKGSSVRVRYDPNSQEVAIDPSEL
ncbi:MAG: hypothetical protein KF821_01530 [Anaerolineales bacterium]|jgi:hypothetical protein|nr:hypothetical protein [Anaerolineales bacterium]MBX3004491.1 hypothetical protein [Anaerolineales bacterium]MCW5839344.1 hypothetical protein [Anaerolineales bacterium]MCW5888259.1 hypothetical protein [Anaerolineales bacterium]